MLGFRDFITAFRKLEVDHSRPVIVHASLSSFGEVHGGTQTILGSLCSSFDSLIMPVFTYKTMITPEVGSANNAIHYGSGRDTNRMAEIFQADMPADRQMGIIAESLRIHPGAIRSTHPILSFAGLHASSVLEAQTIREPLLPIQKLLDRDGWVLLLGVGQTVNTSIHYAEQVAGRKQFMRWALTTRGVIPCQGFPGCSDGFAEISPHLKEAIHQQGLGEAVIQAIPVAHLVQAVCKLLQENPTALLCEREDCERCRAVRQSVAEGERIS